MNSAFMDYPPRVYDLSLHTVGLIVGILLLASHLIALVRPEQTKGWLLKLPRSRPLGIGLLAVDAVWTFWLVSNMDLGEFSQFRTWLQIGVPIVFVLTLFFIDEFLAVRALGIMALLAAEPILSACFLRPETARLLLVILAYVWLTIDFFGSVCLTFCGIRSAGSPRMGSGSRRQHLQDWSMGWRSWFARWRCFSGWWLVAR